MPEHGVVLDDEDSLLALRFAAPGLLVRLHRCRLIRLPRPVKGISLHLRPETARPGPPSQPSCRRAQAAARRIGAIACAFGRAAAGRWQLRRCKIARGAADCASSSTRIVGIVLLSPVST